METPPLVVDVDGTLTGPDQAVDPRVFDVLREWPAPVVVATGKAMPFPIALCQFVGIEPCVVAENGGVAFVGHTDELVFGGDPDAVAAFVEEYRDRGYDLGWGGVDLANRWRETEVAIALDRDRGPIDELAADHGLAVLDTGFAYHVKSPGVDKGTGLELVCDELGREPGEFLAVGDSENDVPTFALAGESIAVANADQSAREAADRVTDAAYEDGFLEAVHSYLSG
ncbi:phosphoglycolate phosphatase [Halomicrobium salinisoli]|uniref:phosphoglycolate phosphatase n=1 Tax=Halomicrobium salinisoli TaxID=2878391 RepID=UPI001CF07411|nr:phosphoglycolate phosphatase [Halomicrobium salinisoli]